MSGPTPDGTTNGAHDFTVAPISFGQGTQPFNSYRSGKYEVVVDACFPNDGGHIYSGPTEPLFSGMKPSDDPLAVVAALETTLNRSLAPASVCVLDLTGLTRFPGMAQVEAAACVSRAMQLRPETLLIILDQYPPLEDPWTAVAAMDTVVVVSPTGDSSQDDLDKAMVRNALEGVVELDMLASLQERLVRVPGWFPFEYSDGERAYARSWYDGRFCVAEIEALIIEQLSTAPPDVLVLVPSRTSPWFSDAVRAAGHYLQCEVWTFDKALQRLDEPGPARRVHLYTAVARTGDTMARARQQLEGLGQVGALDCTAVLSTHGISRSNGRRYVDPGGFPLNYVLKVDQDIEDATSGLQHSTEDEIGSGPLDPREFWDLVRLCRVKDEYPVPPYRYTAGEIPDTRRMADEYGPWLACRMKSLVDRVTQNMLVLHPEEPVSSTLADHLARQFNVIPIAVPRIPWLAGATLGEDPEKAEQLHKLEEPWALRARSHPAAPVLLLDEFISTGGTVKRLIDVAAALGMRRPTTAVSVLDLREQPSKIDAVTVRSLYHLPLDPPESR